VLREMVRSGLRPRRIWAVRGSFLERELKAEGVTHEELPPRAAFIEALQAERFDLFLSNGCPILLPVSALRSGDRKQFVNIHPSFLPDLRGIDPVPGALLHGRDSGATCHEMDDGIDTGGIIAQVRIPFTADLDAGLLYQLSFIAEKEAYTAAAAVGFRPMRSSGKVAGTLYYSFKPEDLRIDWSAPLTTIVHRIKAFGTRNKGAWFEHNKQRVVVRDAEPVTNPFLVERADQWSVGQVVFVYERKLVVHHREGFIKMMDLDGEWEGVKAGMILG